MGRFRGSFILLLTAIIWGTSFVSQKLGMNYVGPFTFGASRFLIGAIVLIPVIWAFHSWNKAEKDNGEQRLKFEQRDLIKGGILCGIAVFLGASTQQWGIVYTTAGKAGFLTALYIVIVPLLGMFIGKKIRLITWGGAIIAAVGLYLLTVQENFSIQLGDAVVLIGTVFWALQIIIVEAYVSKVDGLKLSFIQFLTAGILSAIAATIFEAPSLQDIIACVGPILYTAIMVVGVAYTLQIIGQKYTSSTVAAIILSLESLFAAISGAIFLGESMSPKELVGCFLMLIAVIMAQIEPKEAIESL